MNVEVREAGQRELARVGDLTAHAYLSDELFAADDDYVAELRDAVRRARGATVLVAVQEGAVIGTVTVATHGSGWTGVAEPGEAEVRMLAVDPVVRGRGIGERLMRAGIRVGFATGADRVVLSTTPAMTAAHALYERMGLNHVPERDRTGADPRHVYVVEQP